MTEQQEKTLSYMYGTPMRLIEKLLATSKVKPISESEMQELLSERQYLLDKLHADFGREEPSRVTTDDLLDDGTIEAIAGKFYRAEDIEEELSEYWTYMEWAEEEWREEQIKAGATEYDLI